MAHCSKSKSKPRSKPNQIGETNCADKQASPEVDGAWSWIVVISTFLIHVVGQFHPFFKRLITVDVQILFKCFHEFHVVAQLMAL